MSVLSPQGIKGSRGPPGIPGRCPTWCGTSDSNQCEIGARSVLQQALVDGNVSMAALRAVVDEGNKTARGIENGTVKIENLSVERANSVYAYLMFENSICDANALRIAPPDSECIIGTHDQE